MTGQPSVLLSGATGFLGGKLAAHFRALGTPVAALVRAGTDPQRIPAGVEVVPLSEDAEALRRDLGDRAGWALVHCAAFAAPPGPDLAGLEAEIAGNLALSVRLTEAAVAAGVRSIVNVGSFWEHDEDGNLRPFNSYAAMKAAFQTYLDYIAHRQGAGVVTLKLCETYCEGDTRRKLLPSLVRAAVRGEAMDLSDGLQKTSFCHTDDICRAFSQAIALTTQTPATHERFYVNDRRLVSIREVGGIVAACAAPRPVRFNWGVVPVRPGLPRSAWLGDRTLPDWQPRIALEEGIARMVAALEPTGDNDSGA